MEDKKAIVFTERLVRIIGPIVGLFYREEKEYKIHARNPPIEIMRMRKELSESNFLTTEEESAFRQGWMAAVTTITKDEFPYTTPLSKINGPQ